jgi:hypothetical protein
MRLKRTVYLKEGNWWINDSWLVMPWKLQDPGVNLTYVKDKLPSGTTVDILQLTFTLLV